MIVKWLLWVFSTDSSKSSKSSESSESSERVLKSERVLRGLRVLWEFWKREDIKDSEGALCEKCKWWPIIDSVTLQWRQTRDRLRSFSTKPPVANSQSEGALLFRKMVKAHAAQTRAHQQAQQQSLQLSRHSASHSSLNSNGTTYSYASNHRYQPTNRYQSGRRVEGINKMRVWICFGWFAVCEWYCCSFFVSWNTSYIILLYH